MTTEQGDGSWTKIPDDAAWPPPSEKEALRNVNAVMQAELDSSIRREHELEGELAAAEQLIAQLQNPFTVEDVELIKAHVRHPGALEAAKLKERIACARIALHELALREDGSQAANIIIAILGAP
jgi:regulator of sirC expression with transglutaminase-like and TPR domain